MKAAERALVEHLAVVAETRREPCSAATPDGPCQAPAQVGILLDTLGLHRLCKVHASDLVRSLGLGGQHSDRYAWWPLVA